MTLAGRILERVAEMLDRVDFTPAALRADLNGGEVSARTLYAAAEMIKTTAADLFSDFAGLVHDNEPRWRVFHARLQELATTPTDGRGQTFRDLTRFGTSNSLITA